jgi:hypothetical protein
VLERDRDALGSQRNRFEPLGWSDEIRGAALIVLAMVLVSCGGAVEETPVPMDAAPATVAPSYTPPVVKPESHDLTLADVERLMEELSNWGRWGADDQLGAANLITPAKRLEAIALATEGITVSLEHALLTEEAPDGPAQSLRAAWPA